MKRLNEVVVSNDNFIFANMPIDLQPWNNLISGSDLDILFMSKFGQRSISPLVNLFVGVNGKIDDNSMERLSTLIGHKFKYNWKRLWDSIIAEYDPLYNYQLTEEVSEEVIESGNSTISDESGVESTHTSNDSGNDSALESNELNSANSFYGFNSTNGVNREKDVDTESRENTRTYTENSSQSIERSETKNVEKSDEKNNTRTFKRTEEGLRPLYSSNSFQQLLDSERNTWMWSFFDNIFDCVRKELTLKIY